jgi:hypothetical protein
MRRAEASLPQQHIPHQPLPRETWDMVRRAPRFDDFLFLMEQQLETAREVYIEQPANELNRGKVLALKQVVHFLKTGETP